MTPNEEIMRLLPRVEIDREAINNAWNALERIHRCAHCEADALTLLMYFSARTVESSRLLIENRQLSDALTGAREHSANLLAAIRAAISADHDGEGDPLWYLRDEYTAHDNRPTVREGGDHT